MSGAAGAVWAMGGQACVVFDFTIEHGKIVAIDLLADPERLGQLELTILNDRGQSEFGFRGQPTR